MNCDSKNLVIVFQPPVSKSVLKYDELRNLIPGEPAEMLDLPDPLAPVVFEYKRANLGITFIGNNLQVQTNAPEQAKASREFTDIIGRILNSLPGQQTIIAFGFNFNYSLASAPQKVHEIIGLSPHLVTSQQFTFTPETFVKLSYVKDDVKYFLAVQDNGPNMLIHVNAHFDSNVKIDELKERISTHYEIAHKNSQQLIQGVIQQ